MSLRCSARRILHSACSWSWRIRSRDRLYFSPISLSVSSCSISRPKRWRKMSASIGLLAEDRPHLALQRVHLEVGGRRRVLLVDPRAPRPGCGPLRRRPGGRATPTARAPTAACSRPCRAACRWSSATPRWSGCAPTVVQLAAGLGQPVVRVDHVHRQADLAALVGERAADRVADPPRRVGRSGSRGGSRSARPP